MEYSDIDGLNFSIMNDEFIDQITNIVVKTHDNGSNQDQQDSVASLTMGSNSDFISCETCRYEKKKCPGHPGKIYLKTYVNSPIFIPEIIIFLKIFCHKCGRIVIDSNETSISRLATVITSKIKKGLTCVHCGNLHPYVYENRKEGRGNIVKEFYEYNKKNKVSTKISGDELTPNEIHNIFSLVTEDTLKHLGIKSETQPKNYVNKIFYVPPNSIRPNAFGINTVKIPKNDINLHINNILKESRKLGDISMMQKEDKFNVGIIKSIQKSIYGFKKPLPSSNDKQPISMTGMLSTKNGYIRGIVLGARLLRIMRAFITGNPNAKLDEVYIPEKMAREIQIEEVVTKYNIDKLMKYVANGSDIYPRCLNIYKIKDKAYYLTSVRKNISIEVGDIIYRDICDGDFAAFCRMPTLMMSNIVGMRIRVEKDGKTFNFNPNITPGFAADFDGDEMNKYLPPDIKSAFEIKKTSGLQEQIISNGYGTPIVGQIQDGILGLALLTRDNVKFSMTEACRMFDNTKLFPNMNKYDGTGRGILTVLFQVLGIKINYKGTSNYYVSNLNKYRSYSITEKEVVIKNGEFISGIIDKATVGPKKNGNLYHIIYHKYGAQITIDIIWYMQRIAINYLNLKGFTIGIVNFQISDEQLENIKKKELAIIQESIKFTEMLHEGKIVAPNNKTLEEFYEEEQLNILNGSNPYGEYIHKGMDFNNNPLYFSVYTGSKGSPANLMEVTTSIGQIQTYGMRLQKKLSGRASHFYSKDSTDPRSRGYILNSYYSGLTPGDIVNASYSHRIGIIDKALSTAESGTKYREGTSSLDSLVTNYYYSVQKGVKLRQVLYGGDGMDPRATFRVTPPIVDLNNKDIRKICEDFEYEKLVEARDFYRKVFIKQNNRTGESFSVMGYIPINMPLILDEIGEGRSNKNIDMGLYDKLHHFIDNIGALYFNSNYKGKIPDYANDAVTFFRYYLRYALRYDIVKNYTEKQINALELLITKHFNNNLENAGTCVGIRASQAISEPNTQQMLDSQHSQGGVKIDNFKNIMSAVHLSKLTHTSMEIYLKEEAIDEAEMIAKEIEMLKISYFISAYQVFYETFGKTVHPKYINENDLIGKQLKGRLIPGNLVNWCIRYEFNISKLITRNITLEDIFIIIMDSHPYLFIVFETLNISNIMRIYLKQDAVLKYNITCSNDIIILINDINDLIVRGIKGIKTAVVKDKIIYKTDDEGNLIGKNIKYIVTEGTNMAEIMMHPKVNTYLTTSNSITEMYDFFGICTSRNMTLDGLRESVKDAYYSHYTIFADEMNSCYFYSALNRYGSAARGTSICQLIADSAFLKSIKIAAINGITDYNVGPNSALIMGTTGKVGTNYAEIVVNEEFIQQENSINEKELEDL